MSNLTGVTNFFSTANEGFVATLSSGILANATTVPLSNVTGLTDGSVFVAIIEPTGVNQQTFTGTVDYVHSQIINVIWTRGTNVAHSAGVTVVDYVTGTDWNMMIAGILKHANQAGNLNPTDIYDANGGKILSFSAFAPAANRLIIGNATAGSPPFVVATGTDTNVGINFATKGSDISGQGLRYNNIPFRALPKDWCRYLLGWATPLFEQPVGTSAQSNGTGWAFPANTASWLETSNTQNAEIRYKIYLDAGTYTFNNYYRTGSDKGSVTWGFIDEQGVTTTVGSSTDLYVASGSSQITVNVTGITFANGGYYKLWFKAATKNASSTGYILPYFGSQITRTA